METYLRYSRRGILSKRERGTLSRESYLKQPYQNESYQKLIWETYQRNLIGSFIKGTLSKPNLKSLTRIALQEIGRRKFVETALSKELSIGLYRKNWFEGTLSELDRILSRELDRKRLIQSILTRRLDQMVEESLGEPPFNSRSSLADRLQSTASLLLDVDVDSCRFMWILSLSLSLSAIRRLAIRLLASQPSLSGALIDNPRIRLVASLPVIRWLSAESSSFQPVGSTRFAVLQFLWLG